MDKSKCSLLLVMLLLVASSAVFAAPELKVEGLFDGTAVVNISGTRRIIKAGQESPEGVKLLSANSDFAIFEYAGERLKLGLSSKISSGFSEAKRKRVIVNKGGHNGYFVNGVINGHSVRMLVDTGATHIAMSSEVAKRIGIDYLRKGKKTPMRTASDIVEGWFLLLERVSVGGIDVHNVRASVTEGRFPHDVLLGMSYLRHVKMEESDGVLYLTEKH